MNQKLSYIGSVLDGVRDGKTSDGIEATIFGHYRPAIPFLIADIGSLVDVGTMNEDNLNWLSQWYLAQCDGDWEHSYGVKIDTLDNPGWTIKIDLTDTPMRGIAFERIEHGKIGDDFEEWQRSGSWWVARVEGHSFDVSCGPLDLSSAIGVFRRWVEVSA